jgi:hypothetical protein
MKRLEALQTYETRLALSSRAETRLARVRVETIVIAEYEVIDTI